MSKKQKQHQMIKPGHALGVNVIGTQREDVAYALKVWKRKVKAANVLETVKEHKEYKKPTSVKRQQRIRAEYIQSLKDLKNK